MIVIYKSGLWYTYQDADLVNHGNDLLYNCTTISYRLANKQANIQIDAQEVKQSQDQVNTPVPYCSI